MLSLNPYAPLNKGYALLKYKEHFLSTNQSLKDYDSFDIIRKNETVTASLINNVSSPIVQAKAKKKSIKKKIENANELF